MHSLCLVLLNAIGDHNMGTSGSYSRRWSPQASITEQLYGTGQGRWKHSRPGSHQKANNSSTNCHDGHPGVLPYYSNRSHGNRIRPTSNLDTPTDESPFCHPDAILISRSSQLYVDCRLPSHSDGGHRTQITTRQCV